MSLDLDSSRSAAEARTMLESTPNRGKTPILMTSDIALENGITWRGRFDVPKGVIEDTIVLAASSRLMLPKP
jgi:Mg-chelatase subunit ChlD